MSKQNKDETKVGNKVEKEMVTVFTLNTTHDEVVDNVIYEFKDRSTRGQNKYGTTLAANEKDDFLQHLKEELMDATLYIQKLQSQINNNNNNK